MTKSGLWTRAQVAERILAGDAIVIRHGTVLRIPKAWLDQHPGGELAILHFVGRDAGDEISAFHPKETLDRMNAFAVGRVDVNEKSGWQPFMPPVMSGWRRFDGVWQREAGPLIQDGTSLGPQQQLLLVKREVLDKALTTDSSGPSLETLEPLPTDLQLSTQLQHSLAYNQLHQKIIASGLYKTRYLAGYGPEITRYVSLAALAIWTYRCGWFLASAFFLGGLWHQLTFTAHDLGHNGVTHNWAVDRLLGVFVADLCGGLSIGWWVDNHNIHHLVTNHPSHDPDIQHLPFFAISPSFAKSLWSSYYRRLMAFDGFASLIIRVQHMLFYVIMSLARFNLYRLSYLFLAQRSRYTKLSRRGRLIWQIEIICLCLFWTWYALLLRGCGTWRMRLAYLLISHVVPSPLHVQIVLSHFSRSTDDLGPVESFPQRQLRTTTDVICPDHLAFLHGGLHLQVTHHLFPRLPRHNLKEASSLVKQFCDEQGLEYAEFGFFEGNTEVRGVLREVANQVSIMKVVAKSTYLHDKP